MPRLLLATFAAMLTAATAAKAQPASFPPPPPAGIIDSKQQCVRTCAVPPTFVVNVGESGQAWQAQVDLLPTSVRDVAADIPIPAGYTLVIENVSAVASATGPVHLDLFIYSELQSSARNRFHLANPGTPSSDGEINQVTKIYTRGAPNPNDPTSNNVRVRVSRDGSSFSGVRIFATVTINGRLVPNG